MPLRDVMLALVIVTIWGINFTVIKLTMAEIPPVLLAALRFFFAAIPAVFFVPRPKAPWLLVTAYGLTMGTVLYSLLNIGLAMGMPASLSSLVLQTQAIFTVLLAAAFLGERPRPLQIVGGLVAIGGIAVIGSVGLAGVPLLPFLILIFAAFSWGIANILSKKAGNINMLAFTVWGNLIGSIPLFGLSLLFEGPERVFGALAHPSWSSIGLVAFLAYPATLMGFAIWGGLLRRHPVSVVAPFTLLVPIAGIISGVVVLGETLHSADIIGCGLIFVGLALTFVKLKPKQAALTPAA